MLGLSTGLPAAFMRCRQRHFMANPPSMAASLEPVVEQPSVLAASGEFQRSASIWTHRASISAVCGYSSLSIMFLSRHSFMSLAISGSTQVWQKVARFWRELPSSMSSSRTT